MEGSRAVLKDGTGGLTERDTCMEHPNGPYSTVGQEEWAEGGAVRAGLDTAFVRERFLGVSGDTTPGEAGG